MKSKVYFSKEITPEKVVEAYKALGIELPGKVADQAEHQKMQLLVAEILLIGVI